MEQKQKAILRQNLTAYLFLLPTLLLFIYFVCIPILQSVHISMTDWNGLSPKKFIGLKNYIELVKNDQMFGRAILNNVIWAVASATIPVWIGLLTANALVRGNIRFRNFFQIILFLPQVISTVIAAVIWKWIYDPALGPLNSILTALGLEKYACGWLGEPNTVLAALFLIYVWQSFGFCMVIFTSAIQCVDEQLYEAAIIDGCGRTRQFFNVTLPGVRQAMTTTILLMVISSFQIFDLVVTTTLGGPGYSSYVVSYYVYYQGIVSGRAGYGAAISIVLTVIVLIFSRWFTYMREKE